MSYCSHPKEELRPIAPGRYWCALCGDDGIWPSHGVGDAGWMVPYIGYEPEVAPLCAGDEAARQRLSEAVAGLNAMEIAPLLYLAERTRMGRHIYGPKGHDESRDMLAELLAELADGVNYLVWSGEGRKQHGTEHDSG